MQIKATQKIEEYTNVGGEYKKVALEQELSFGTWDDFQNWQSYTVEALGGKPLNITVKIVKETE